MYANIFVCMYVCIYVFIFVKERCTVIKGDHCSRDPDISPSPVSFHSLWASLDPLNTNLVPKTRPLQHQVQMLNSGHHCRLYRDDLREKGGGSHGLAVSPPWTVFCSEQLVQPTFAITGSGIRVGIEPSWPLSSNMALGKLCHFWPRLKAHP